VRRKRSGGLSNVAAGLIALIVISVGVYLGFSKDVPFIGKRFELRAVFDSANSIRPGSPVRIAGVNVGKVERVEAEKGTNAAVVIMEINDEGLPIHEDARVKIRPRIFLEGNFFVDLRPGTPSARALESGDSLKVTQAATPVQLDEVLTALQDDTREDLKAVLDQLGNALMDEPTAEQDRRNDPITRGETAAESFNDTLVDAGPAQKATAIVSEAFLGTEPEEDIQRLIKGLGSAAEGLSRNEVQLKDLVTNFNVTMAALASEQDNLRASIRELGPTLESANGALAELNETFPPLRAFSREILPGVRETPATIDASFPWIEQTRRLLGRAELGGLARGLSASTTDLARLVDESLKLLPEAELLSRCASDVFLPTGDIPITDEFPSGVANYKEFWYTMVALAGESQNFDGNGQYVRLQPGGGGTSVSFGEQGTAGGALFGNAFENNMGARPKKPPRKPPYNAKEPCHTQPIPNLNGPWAAKADFGVDTGRGTPTRLTSSFGGAK
jgi:phospholipid/cholesterol/gamma-HCH transport system substrate-binding protein